MDTLPPFKTGKPRVEQGYVRPLVGIELPFTIIEGGMPGPCLVVTAGVHASEFCSIEAAVRLQRTRPEDINGTLVVLPIMNVQGFWKRSIYVMPEDGKNLNRQFPGDADGTASQRLAHWLTSAVLSKADFYLDLHGGDLDAARAAFPDAPLPWVDLSTGINAVPFPPPELPPHAWTVTDFRALNEYMTGVIAKSR